MHRTFRLEVADSVGSYRSSVYPARLCTSEWSCIANSLGVKVSRTYRQTHPAYQLLRSWRVSRDEICELCPRNRCKAFYHQHREILMRIRHHQKLQHTREASLPALKKKQNRATLSLCRNKRDGLSSLARIRHYGYRPSSLIYCTYAPTRTGREQLKDTAERGEELHACILQGQRRKS